MSSPQPILLPNANAPLHASGDSTEHQAFDEAFWTTLRAVGIFMAFCLLALVWKTVYFKLIRACKWQRWKSLTKLEHILHIHDRIKSNSRSMLLHRADENHLSYLQRGFFQEGIHVNQFNNHPSHNGINLEFSTTPYEVRRNSSRPRVFGSHRGDPSFAAATAASVHQFDTTHVYGGFTDHSLDTQYIEEIWFRPTKRSWINRIRRFFGCREKVSRRHQIKNPDYSSEEQESAWQKFNARKRPFVHGFSYKGYNWYPKDIEGRSVYKYLRGNFMTLVGSSITAIIILIGLKMALHEARIDLTMAITGGTLIFFISFLKVADYFAPIIAYFSLLWADTVERGTIIGFNSNIISGTTLNLPTSGVVLDITPSSVCLLLVESHKEHLAQYEKQLSKLQFASIKNNHQTNQAPHEPRHHDTLNDNTNNISNSNNNNNNTTNSNNANNNKNTQNPAIFVGAPAQPRSPAPLSSDEQFKGRFTQTHYANTTNVNLIELDYMKENGKAHIPTDLFYRAVKTEYFSWTPVARIEQL